MTNQNSPDDDQDRDDHDRGPDDGPPESWRDIEDCESCGQPERPTRAIQMREGRPRRLCRPCFLDAVDEDRVSPRDPRL